MKRSAAWILVGLSLGVAVYFGSRSGAVPAPAAAPPTRVAILNLRWVIKKYDRYQRFIESMKKEEKKFIDTMQQKQQQVNALTQAVQALQGPQREAKEKELSVVQKEMEDLKQKVREDVGKRSNEEMVAVYKLVRDAASRYAKTHKFDVVLHFEGPAEKAEEDSPVLVMRNINAGGCVPLYCDPSLDISEP